MNEAYHTHGDEIVIPPVPAVDSQPVALVTSDGHQHDSTKTTYATYSGKQCFSPSSQSTGFGQSDSGGMIVMNDDGLSRNGTTYNPMGMTQSALMSSVVIQNSLRAEKGILEGIDKKRNWNHNFAGTLLLPIIASLLSAAWILKTDLILFYLRARGAYIGLALMLCIVMISTRSAMGLINLHQRYSATRRQEVATMHGSMVSKSPGRVSYNEPAETETQARWIFEVFGPASATLMLLTVWFQTVAFGGFFLQSIGAFLAPFVLSFPIIGDLIEGQTGIVDGKWDLVTRVISWALCLAFFCLGSRSVNRKNRSVTAIILVIIPLLFAGWSLVTLIYKSGYVTTAGYHSIPLPIDAFNHPDVLSAIDVSTNSQSWYCEAFEQVAFSEDRAVSDNLVRLSDGSTCARMFAKRTGFSKFRLVDNLRFGITYASCLEFFLTALLIIGPSRNKNREAVVEALDDADTRTAKEDIGISQYSTSVAKFCAYSTIVSCGCLLYAFYTTFSRNTNVLVWWEPEAGYYGWRQESASSTFYDAMFGSVTYLRNNAFSGTQMLWQQGSAWLFFGTGLAATLVGMQRLISTGVSTLHALIDQNPLPAMEGLDRLLSSRLKRAVTVSAVFCVTLAGDGGKVASLVSVFSLFTYGMFNLLAAVTLWLDELSAQDRQLKRMRLSNVDDGMNFINRLRYHLEAHVLSAAATASMATILCSVLLSCVSPFSFALGLLALSAAHSWLVGTSTLASEFRKSRLDNVKSSAMRNVLAACNPQKLITWKPSALIVSKFTTVGQRLVLQDPDLSIMVDALSDVSNCAIVGIPVSHDSQESASLDDLNHYAIHKQHQANVGLRAAFRDLGVIEVSRLLVLPIRRLCTILSAVVPMSVLGAFDPNLIFASYPIQEGESGDEELRLLLEDARQWDKALALLKTDSSLAPICLNLSRKNACPKSPLSALKRGPLRRAAPVSPLSSSQVGTDLFHTETIDVWWFDVGEPIICLFPLLLAKFEAFSQCKTRLFLVQGQVPESDKLADEEVTEGIAKLKALLKDHDIKFSETTVIRMPPYPLFESLVNPGFSTGNILGNIPGVSPANEGDFFAENAPPSEQLSLRAKIDEGGVTEGMAGSPLRLVEASENAIAPSRVLPLFGTASQLNSPTRGVDENRKVLGSMTWPLRAQQTVSDARFWAEAAIKLNSFIKYHSGPATFVVSMLPSKPQQLSISTYRMFIESTFHEVKRLVLLVKDVERKDF